MQSCTPAALLHTALTDTHTHSLKAQEQMTETWPPAASSAAVRLGLGSNRHSDSRPNL